MTRKWKRVSAIVAAVGLAVVLVGIAGWQLLLRYFTQQYYRQEYQPIQLTASIIDEFPAEHHLVDVPWIAAAFPTCQSVSLQMIAAQRGIKHSLGHYDFLMGFTYGASELPGAGFTPFGTDPETGMNVAAPYLGLLRHYYVTDDADLYRDALRYFLSQGYPVRVAVDMGTLYGFSEFTAHSEVLVGYNSDGFAYYETVCSAPATCEPGEHEPGQESLFVSDTVLLDAVHAQSKPLKYPWRYALTIFEPGPTATDLAPVWAQNSLALIGGNPYGPKTGADAIDALAEQIEQRGRRFDTTTIETGIEIAAITRPNNAAYLREAFADDEDILQAAALFDQAAAAYRAIQPFVAGGIGNQEEAAQIAINLREAAAAERQAGEIFRERSK